MKQGMRKHRFWTKLAAFILAAAMNPCPCGNYPDLEKCTCTPPQIRPNRGDGSAGGRAVCRAGAKPGGGTGRGRRNKRSRADAASRRT